MVKQNGLDSWTDYGNRKVVTTGNLSRNEEALQQAFNDSGWKPVSLTFATLRAFNFERYLQNKEFNTNHHSSCVVEFKSLLKTIKNIPEVPASDGLDSIAEMIATASSDASATKQSGLRKVFHTPAKAKSGCVNLLIMFHLFF